MFCLKGFIVVSKDTFLRLINPLIDLDLNHTHLKTYVLKRSNFVCAYEYALELRGSLIFLMG